jgi:hypothetical protein
MGKSLIISIVILLGLGLGASAQSWPKEFTGPKGKLVMYEPQPQKIDANKVSGVMAVSVLATGKKEPVFGALFFDAFINIDRETRRYSLEKFSIPSIKFSGKLESKDEEFLKKYIEEQILAMQLIGSLDELLTSIEDFQSDNKKNENFRNDPPAFIYTTIPSVLIMIDGEPKFQDIKNTDLKHVANSGYVIFENKSDRQFYLFGGEVWYTAPQIKGPWQVTKNVPKDVKKLLDQNKDAAKNAGKVETTGKETPPAVVVATEPTELIQTEGDPKWKKYDSVDISIEYADNSDDNLFKIGSTFYVLKSGRWFKSQSMNSGWQYVPADQLPKDFSKIPSGSPKDIVLSSVPGTLEARDALLDAQVPQTATVDRKTGGKDIKVQYDGKPQYEKIEGTSLELVKNSDKTVFRTSSLPLGYQGGKSLHDQAKYYMVDNGIWYASSSPDGPWYVSDTRPAGVEDIPPSSSAYNTKYVQIYDSSPDVVYVGYTPGYMGSYIYGPTVIYGTGYHYTPWYGSMYYPHHSTWGFNMNYNPWTGWSIGFGFTSGPFHFGFGTGGFSFGMSWGFGGPIWGYPPGMGWFGPPMYRPPCFRPHYPWYGYNRPGYGGGGHNNWGNGGNINWGGGNQINIGGDVNINIGSGNNNINQAINNKGNNLYSKNKKTGVSTGIAGKDMSKVDFASRPTAKPGTGSKPTTGARPGTGGPATKPTTAAKPGNGGQTTKPSTGGPSTKPTTPTTRPTVKPSTQPNNVFADRDGNVYQRDNKTGNVQQNKGGNTWDRPSNNNNRMYNPTNDRNRGSNRAKNYQQARPAPRPTPSARPAARPAGGGGVRRR